MTMRYAKNIIEGGYEMLINNCGQIQEWAGVWPAKKNSRRIVCVLAGSAHAGLDGAEYIGTHYSRISREEYDWFRLPAGTKIIRAVDEKRKN